MAEANRDCNLASHQKKFAALNRVTLLLAVNIIPLVQPPTPTPALPI